MEVNEYGDKVWRNKEGDLHRTDGPAIEYPNSSKVWYQAGKLHREEGAAVEYVNGYKEYWYGGERYFEIENDQEWERSVRLMVFG